MNAQAMLTWALLAAFSLGAVPPVSTANVRPKGLPGQYTAIPLGQIRVTHYTHHECGSRLTASGYRLKDSDEGHVCAVSRDWWRSRIKPGDLIWIEGHAQPCVALDTMALRNRKGFPQRHWVDIYYTDRDKALDFGIHRATAYLLRPRVRHARRPQLLESSTGR